MSTIGLAKILTSVATVAGISAGSPFLHQWRLESLTRKSGSGKATNPRLRISKEGSKTELSFDASAFFGGAPREKSLNFNQVSVTFAGRKLSAQDVFCSPGQNGIYVLLKHEQGGKYRIEGTSRYAQNCDKRHITDIEKLKTFRLDWPSNHLKNMTPSKIAVGSCQFVLDQTDTGWRVILRGCKDTMNTRVGMRETMSDKILVSSDYFLN